MKDRFPLPFACSSHQEATIDSVLVRPEYRISLLFVILMIERLMLSRSFSISSLFTNLRVRDLMGYGGNLERMVLSILVLSTMS